MSGWSPWACRFALWIGFSRQGRRPPAGAALPGVLQMLVEDAHDFGGRLGVADEAVGGWDDFFAEGGVEVRTGVGDHAVGRFLEWTGSAAIADDRVVWCQDRALVQALEERVPRGEVVHAAGAEGVEFLK